MSIGNYLNKQRRQRFHFKHKIYAQLAYIFPWFPPHRYVFVLTNQCNLKCSFCFQEKESSVKAMAKEKWIELSEIIPSFARITLTGGEPLLFGGFKEVFAHVAKRHSCNLITNGTLLTEDIIDMMLSFPKFAVLSISIDDCRKDTFNLRGFSLRQWENLEAMIRYFHHRRDKMNSSCTLEVKTLILDENAEELMRIRRFCAEDLKTDHQSFQFLKGSPLQHADKPYPLKDIFKKPKKNIYKKFDVILEQLEQIRQYNVAWDKAAFLHPQLDYLNNRRPLKDLSYLNCGEFYQHLFASCKFPWSSIHINYDGEVFPCLSVSLGNVQQQSLKEIVKGAAYRRFLSIIRKHGLVEACSNCGWLVPLK